MRSSRLQKILGLSSVLFAVLFASTLVASSTVFAQATDGSSTARASAQVREEWIARGDSGSAIAVDAQGNVYVTGGSEGGYATIKYNSTGKLLWERYYNDPEKGFGSASAIAVDAQGNVYVTGQIGGGTSGDYATLKYDSTGSLLWARRYDGPGGSNFEGPGANGDVAHALAVDQRGNVYVTGRSLGLETGVDYATLKYDSAGNLLWAKRYNGPGNNYYYPGYNYDEAYALAVDLQGNVYVTGVSTGDVTGFDYATLKYDSAGNLLWVQRYQGLENNSRDIAKALAVDEKGNVYVTGNSGILRGAAVPSGDYTTLKYDTAGKLLWERRYDGSGNGYSASALAVDPQGNVYVTGFLTDTGGDSVTLKYYPDGNLQWVQHYNGSGDAGTWLSALAVDPQGNVYVTGATSIGIYGIYPDYATLKYSSNGILLWERRYNGPGDRNDVANALAVDPQGNVYVTGSSDGDGTGTDNAATIKYSQGPEQQPAQ